MSEELKANENTQAKDEQVQAGLSTADYFFDLPQELIAQDGGVRGVDR